MFLDKIYPLITSFSDLIFLSDLEDIDSTENISYFLKPSKLLSNSF